MPLVELVNVKEDCNESRMLKVMVIKMSDVEQEAATSGKCLFYISMLRNILYIYI